MNYASIVAAVAAIMISLLLSYDYVHLDSIHLLKAYQLYIDQSTNYETEDIVLTKAQLWKYTSANISPNIYLAIVGRVFDVTSGARFYGADGSYKFFSGIDGSRAFASGKFIEDGLTDDVSDLSPLDCAGIQSWLEHYYKQYTYVGKVEGYFFDDRGSKRAGLLSFEEKLKEAHRLQQDSAETNSRFPECNSKWDRESGTEFWCSTKSGGVDRSWVGYPRELFNVGTSNEARCACVKESDIDDPRVKPYKGCDVHATSCIILP